MSIIDRTSGEFRDALELYKSQNSSYPAANTLADDLKPFLRGPFPASQVGANQNDTVVASTQNPITSVEAGGAGWAYNATTGEIRVNDASALDW